MDAEAWRHAKSVLAEVLTLPPGERAALIAARCPDEAFRREVESYLHEYDQDFLEDVITVSDRFDSSESVEPPELPEGSHIGPYRIVRRLGVGGMGHVFLGDDERLDRKVALKCLISAPSAGDVRAKILDEARAAARINHPNIAVVHDVIDYDGRSFLVMEYVEGDNLATVLKRERLPLERILTMGRQLASALGAAHAKGIIHRDLKPANIQVTPDGAVKVLDFGVAQAISVLASESAAALDSGGVVMHPGTPAYMSPEQMFGRPIDQRSDIYSLGVVLYEMATGTRPYASDDPLTLVASLSRAELPKGDITNVPPEVGDVIAKALAVNPEERYQSAAALEADVAAIMASYAPEADTPARLRARSRSRAFLRAAVGVPSAVALIWAIGFLTTAHFNTMLQRSSPFSREPASASLVMGLRSLVTPAIFIAAMVIVLWAIRFVIRLVSLAPPVDVMLTTGRTRTRRLRSRLGLDNPIVLAQAVATLGVIAVLGVVWLFRDIEAAWTTILPLYPELAARVAPLRPDRAGRAELYRFVLDVLILFFGIATVRLWRLQASYPLRRRGGSMGLVVLLLSVVVLMSELPYRLMWQNKFDRVTFGGDRCYIIGESDAESLLYCPDKDPPMRNQIVSHTDPSVRRSGAKESIFTPLPATR